MKSAWKYAVAVVAFSMLVMAAAASVSAQVDSYSFTDLGSISTALYGSTYTLQQPVNEAYGINDSGQVVGVLKGKFSGTSQSHFIVWDGVGTSNVTATSIYANSGKIFDYGINDSGVIVGNNQVASSYNAMQYNPNTQAWSNIGTPSDGVSVQTVATAINNSGQIVGYAGNQAGPNAQNTAFMYSNGTIQDIPGATVAPPSSSPNSNNSAANAINNKGLVTGYSTVNGIAQAFVYDSSVGTAAGFKTLGTLGGATSYGTGINDSGEIVGYSLNSSSVQHAFYYTSSIGMIDMGALGGAGNTSQANAINNLGVIVGTSNGRAFVYENNQMYDLNSLIGSNAEAGFTLTDATGINNLDQIVGYGTNALGNESAFALTLDATPAPIPSTVFLFGSGLLGMIFIRRRNNEA